MKSVLLLLGFIQLFGQVQAQPPKADFDFKVEYNCLWATVSVTSLSENADILLWDLHGRGNYEHINNPNPPLGNVGEDYDYKVSLIAKGNGLADTITKTFHLNLTRASFAYTVHDTLQMAPLTVDFINTSQQVNGDTILNWLWDFGDGTTSTLKNPAHVFCHPDTYYIRLEAFTQSGCTLSYHMPFTVKDTAQRDEFDLKLTGCSGDHPPCGWDQHFEIGNDTLRMFGFYDGNCCTQKTATVRSSGDTIYVRTFESGPACNCTCMFCFSINVPGIGQDSVIVSFDGKPVVARVVTSVRPMQKPTLEVYPNPVAGELTVTCNQLSPQSEIEIRELTGRIIYRLQGMLSSKVVIPCSGISPGVYLLRVVLDKEHVMTKKIIIART